MSGSHWTAGERQDVFDTDVRSRESKSVQNNAKWAGALSVARGRNDASGAIRLDTRSRGVGR